MNTLTRHTKGTSANGQASEEFTTPLCFEVSIKTNIFYLPVAFLQFFRRVFILILTSWEEIQLHSKAKKRYRQPFMSHLKPCFEGLSAIFYTEMNFILQ